MRIPLMPNEETPRPHDSEALRASIDKLSQESARLRELAKKNSEEADRILRRVAELERAVVESEGRKAKKRSGQISG